MFLCIYIETIVLEFSLSLTSVYIYYVDEEKEQEMQIGNPTDVKHVAHIGFDGPAVQESPSWVNSLLSATLINFVISVFFFFSLIPRR